LKKVKCSKERKKKILELPLGLRSAEKLIISTCQMKEIGAIK
jgi:hypothetical protein